MPHGLVHLFDLIAPIDCGQSCYHPGEQLHLVEFAALQVNNYNDALGMDILVRKKPFREESREGFVNDDLDSEGEAHDANKKRIHSEFLGGVGESDCEEQEDTEGDLAIKRQALKRATWKNVRQCSTETKKLSVPMPRAAPKQRMPK